MEQDYIITLPCIVKNTQIDIIIPNDYFKTSQNSGGEIEITSTKYICWVII